MTEISECNCGNCDNQSTPRCPMKWDGFDGNSDKLSGFTAGNKLCGCLFHPNAREVLMRDVISRLEKRKDDSEFINKCADTYGLRCISKGEMGAFDEAISLIRDGGVKKE